MIKSAIIALAFLLAGTTIATAEPPSQMLRIGIQKTGALVILRQQKALEAALAPNGVRVQWVEFQSGPPLLEALNAGGIDFGYTGDTPPVFAQAGGVDLVYAAYVPVTGISSAILVRGDSPIRAVAELKGKRIALTKGSSAHYQIVRILKSAGLTLADVTPAYLQPADAGAAFRGGSIDAWVIWDPFYAIAERDPGTRVLTDARAAPSNSFFLARRAYATANGAVLATVIRELNRASVWSEQNQDQLASIMAQITGVDIDAQRVAAARGSYKVDFLNDDVIRRQQEVADTFFALKIIPMRIDVRGAVWLPPSRSAAAAGAAP